jgi:hypothetical protein
MKSIVITISCLAFFFLISSCRMTRTFQIECNTVSADATYVVDVVVESKKELSDLGPVKLDAIDGVLFRGLTGSNCVTQQPMMVKSKSEFMKNSLIKNIYGKHKGYEKYVTNLSVISKAPITQTTQQIFQYKYRVAINKDLLRKDLVAAGLIKSLNNGF